MTDTTQHPPADQTRRTTEPTGDGATEHSRLAGSSVKLPLATSVKATLEPLVAALRWCAVVLGTALAAPGAVDGDVSLIIAMSVCLDVTAWRTMRPLRMGSLDRSQRIMSVTDAVLLGAAAGVNEGMRSPFVFCFAVSASIAAFGWGKRQGLVALGAGVGAAAMCAVIAGSSLGLHTRTGLLVLSLTAVVVPTCGAIRDRLIETEARRAREGGRIDTLAETNELLQVLNRVARSLPSSLDLQHTIATTRRQLVETFDADVVGILATSDVSDTWSPLLAEGIAIAPAVGPDDIPPLLRGALAERDPVLVSDLRGKGLRADSSSGAYVALRARGRVVGVLGVESSVPGRYGEHELRLLAGIAEALALTVDNARRFRRLRMLGADEERARIARDLHDRLGQWLTYISFELERIRTSHPSAAAAPDLDVLHQDVQTAIDELRETLRQMRASVTETESLFEVASELMARYSDRTGIRARFGTGPVAERMPVSVENELLRILQEALNNVDKHANATEVVVDWTVDDAAGHFRISDDGDGFDHATGVRETAFGLVGMRERAEVIDARLIVTSAPGAGTTIDVVVPREETP
jgi:signal transduction histidine kinase